MDAEAKVKFISFEPLLKWANYSAERTAKALELEITDALTLIQRMYKESREV